MKIFHFVPNHRNDHVNDFEAMLAKKKEEGSKRRKKRDIDIINDNDDIIDQLIQDMRAAAEVCHLRLQNFLLHKIPIRDNKLFSYVEYSLNRMIVN